jgi:trimethylamine:corrinoid methyltransferase-like protein
MRPTLRLLSPELLARILDEAFELLARLGVRVGSSEVVDLLRARHVEVRDGVAYIHEPLVRDCLSTVPTEFDLYNRQGQAVVHYGDNSVHFDPGSCCVQILDPDTLQARPSTTADLVRLVQVAEMLPQFAAQPGPRTRPRYDRRQAAGDRRPLRCRPAGLRRPVLALVRLAHRADGGFDFDRGTHAGLPGR